MSHPYLIALDHDRELAAEIGLLLSCYAIIDLYIVHIFATLSGHKKDAATVVLSHIRGNSRRTELIRQLLEMSDRPQKNTELELINSIDRATRIRNKYAHAVYSQVDASSTKWRMSMWLSDGGNRKKTFEDFSRESIRADGDYIRGVLQSLSHFGSVEVAYE